MQNMSIKLDKESGMLVISIDPTEVVGQAKKLSTISSCYWKQFRLPDGTELKLNLFLGRKRTPEEELEYLKSAKEEEVKKGPSIIEL